MDSLLIDVNRNPTTSSFDEWNIVIFRLIPTCCCAEPLKF